MSNPLADMEKPDVIFAIGTNMTECHPVAATRLSRALRNGAKMIVADPRRIPWPTERTCSCSCAWAATSPSYSAWRT